MKTEILTQALRNVSLRWPTLVLEELALEIESLEKLDAEREEQSHNEAMRQARGDHGQG